MLKKLNPYKFLTTLCKYEVFIEHFSVDIFKFCKNDANNQKEEISRPFEFSDFISNHNIFKSFYKCAENYNVGILYLNFQAFDKPCAASFVEQLLS